MHQQDEISVVLRVHFLECLLCTKYKQNRNQIVPNKVLNKLLTQMQRGLSSMMQLFWTSGFKREMRLYDICFSIVVITNPIRV